jgi:hypothetical protein
MAFVAPTQRHSAHTIKGTTRTNASLETRTPHVLATNAP